MYKAEDTKLRRMVALKFLPHHIIAEEGSVLLEQLVGLSQDGAHVAEPALRTEIHHIAEEHRIGEMKGIRTAA